MASMFCDSLTISKHPVTSIFNSSIVFFFFLIYSILYQASFQNEPVAFGLLPRPWQAGGRDAPTLTGKSENPRKRSFLCVCEGGEVTGDQQTLGETGASEAASLARP